MQALQVRRVAGYVEIHDLAASLPDDLVAAGDTFDDEAAAGRTVALANDVLVGPDIGGADRHGLDRIPLVIGKVETVCELADERAERHGGAPVSIGGSIRRSLAPAAGRELMIVAISHNRREESLKLVSFAGQFALTRVDSRGTRCQLPCPEPFGLPGASLDRINGIACGLVLADTISA